jgi:hypothetical protein
VKFHRLKAAIGFVVTVLAFAGCATTAPLPSQLAPLPSTLEKGDEVKVTLALAHGFDLNPIGQDHLRQDIQTRIDAKKAQNPMTRPKNRFLVEVTLTAYGFTMSKGNGIETSPTESFTLQADVVIHLLPGQEELASLATGALSPTRTITSEPVEIALADAAANAATNYAMWFRPAAK